MKWRWRLGQAFGIVVYMHVTFLLLIAWVAFIPLGQGRGLPGALYGVLFILLLFLCVVMHEYGHALTARRYGIETRDITLLPIGGVSSLERMPSFFADGASPDTPAGRRSWGSIRSGHGTTSCWVRSAPSHSSNR